MAHTIGRLFLKSLSGTADGQVGISGLVRTVRRIPTSVLDHSVGDELLNTSNKQISAITRTKRNPEAVRQVNQRLTACVKWLADHYPSYGDEATTNRMLLEDFEREISESWIPTLLEPGNAQFGLGVFTLAVNIHLLCLQELAFLDPCAPRVVESEHLASLFKHSLRYVAHASTVLSVLGDRRKDYTAVINVSTDKENGGILKPTTVRIVGDGFRKKQLLSKYDMDTGYVIKCPSRPVTTLDILNGADIVYHIDDYAVPEEPEVYMLTHLREKQREHVQNAVTSLSSKHLHSVESAIKVWKKLRNNPLGLSETDQTAKAMAYSGWFQTD